MALKIRLRQQGRTNRLTYRLVVADSRSPRDGKNVETIGWYNPIDDDESKNLHVDKERVQHWMDCGAQLSENARPLIRRAAPEILEQLQKKEMEKRANAAARRKAKREAK